MIFCKRVYDEVTESDGYRVLVDRLWPRGIKKTDLHYDEWNKDVAPETELRKWFHTNTDKFDEFERRYRQELEDRPQSWQTLVVKAEQGNLTLLFAAKDKEHNQAKVLKAFLEEKQIQCD
ncbi:DUF488 domain-containing protein [Morganella psychrotolerans]|uniref:MarR family transcriptional regulator n=1 Tax=Morganella psychrotolerans TaxID=368603 RepID=A0A1B8HPT2_9GAMM|nr:DUF488 domain-containing protein [Morganella psychrotolerans]OBU11392.1 MarR family transcriptional regulator [Morganella psychrotolerans]